MREWSYALYWLVTGALVGFGFIGSFSIGLPFLVIGMLMSAFGFLKFGVHDSWAFLVGLGELPALVLQSTSRGYPERTEPVLRCFVPL